MRRRVLAGRFPDTTFCQGFKDMPTQSRGHATRRRQDREGIGLSEIDANSPGVRGEKRQRKGESVGASSSNKRN